MSKMGSTDNIDIEIDIDNDTITMHLPEGDYTYTVEELEGKHILQPLIDGGSRLTVYSQGETFTYEEYMQLFGEEP